MWIRAGRRVWAALAFLVLVAGSCGAPAGSPQMSASKPDSQPTGSETPGALRVLATETFLADIAQNVAGTRLKVESLLPVGIDPHSFEPAPGDVTRVAQSTVLIVNGAGLETFLDRLLQNAGGQRQIITASAGLASRTPREGEAAEPAASGCAPGESGDPHFWLDPTKVAKYVENIRDGLSQADPAGAAGYAANADVYVRQLQNLDRWIAGQVEQVAKAQRLLVTNHETLGYFADRYGFQVVGTVIPSVSTDASPSAKQLARLIDQVRATHAQAIFLETGTNAQLAQQVAQETGARVVTDLYTHSTTDAGGPAPDYISMMKHNTQAIVNALK